MLQIKAKDRKMGMSIDELEEAIRLARRAGHPCIKRAEVGFRGQLQSMTFKESLLAREGEPRV